MTNLPIVLASKSPARAAVLTGAGLTFETLDSGVDEDLVKAHLLVEKASPKTVAEVLAEKKALAVSATHPAWVIGADQTLEFDGGLYDKVSDLAMAADRLRLMRGRSHKLHSAVVLAHQGVTVWRDCVTAELTMRPFSETFLTRYLEMEGAACLGSVGCYRLEGPGAQLFSRIDGDYFSILGLPLLGLLEHLRTVGVVKR